MSRASEVEFDSSGRVVPVEEAAAFARDVRRRGGTVALTNGCFDGLHAGHVHLLEQARRLASALIVGVNDDEGVRRLKGEGRPLWPAADRARVVAALRAVDRVVVFGSLTAEPLVLALRPDVYVKGGDYRYQTLPEREAAQAVGARVVLVPLLEGRSTTALVRRLAGGQTEAGCGHGPRRGEREGQGS